MQELLANDPLLKDTVVGNKFNLDTPYPLQIVVRDSSGDGEKLCFDDFIGTYKSYCNLAKVIGNYPSTCIEWVRDVPFYTGTIANRGFYYFEVSNNADSVMVSPLYENDSVLTIEYDGSVYYADLAAEPINSKIFVKSQWRSFEKNVDYTISGVRITFNDEILEDEEVSAFYRFEGDDFGPFPIKKNTAYNNILSGIVVAFGERIVANDVMAVYVGDVIEDNAAIYGGRWNLNIDISLHALDQKLLERLVDFLTNVWIHRIELEDDNIRITSFGLGSQGDSDEYETGHIKAFTSNWSLSLFTDWEKYVPYIFRLINYDLTTVITNDMEDPTRAYTLEDNILDLKDNSN